jgi:polyphenol oxidase
VSHPAFLKAGSLNLPGVAHAFFTRQGGVSEGVYASLNGGVGSRDETHSIATNRARMASALGLGAERLAVPYQVHSADALVLDRMWEGDEARPRCDGIATATPGLALGVTGADCGMILFADPEAQVIGAAHAGWRGALSGVLEATVEAMERLGARRSAIAAALGPCIGPASYEVGPEFVAAFAGEGEDVSRFFAQSGKAGHAMFDLPAYIAERAARAGIGRFESLGLDTYGDEQRFFSFRRATHRREPDYGRLVSAIALTSA